MLFPRCAGHALAAPCLQVSTDITDGGHGSLVAGVAAAVGNNRKGITGVAWEVGSGTDCNSRQLERRVQWSSYCGNTWHMHSPCMQAAGLA